MPSKSFADLIISRFRVESMEGGVVVAGRSFRTASQCPTLTLLFSGCFLVAGVVLTVLAYRPLTASNTHYLQHLSGSQIGGPILVVVGLLFLAVGLALHIVSQRLKLSDQAQRGSKKSWKHQQGRYSWDRCRKWIGWRTKTLSTRRKKAVQDLLATTEFIYMMDRSRSTSSCENRDVASFPNAYPSSVLRSSSTPVLKTRL